MRSIIAIVCLAFIGCAQNPAPQAPSANTAPSAAAKPEAVMAKKHFKEHVQYPATRAAVLAACADTPEFSASEKKWLADNLPDRTFASADDIASALHL
jgi:hypothetical protein